MAKYKNIRYKEVLQLVLNLTTVTTQITKCLENILAILIGFQYFHTYQKKRKKTFFV